MKALITKGIGFTFNTLSYFSKRYASEKALNLFSTPRQGRINEKQATFLNTSEKETLFHNDFAIQTYKWQGDSGKTILLLHGWESNAARWKPLIKKLKKENHTVLAIDGPAHGNSGSKLFNAVLYSDFVNVAANYFKPNHIIGHSVGGMTTVFHQEFHNYKGAEKIILLGAPSEFTGVFKRYVDMMGYNKRIENSLNQLVVDRFNKQPSYFSLPDFVGNVNAKGLIIHDTEDDIIPYNDAVKISNNYKNAEFKTTTGYGHGLKGKLIDSHIIDFINS